MTHQLAATPLVALALALGPALDLVLGLDLDLGLVPMAAVATIATERAAQAASVRDISNALMVSTAMTLVIHPPTARQMALPAPALVPALTLAPRPPLSHLSQHRRQVSAALVTSLLLQLHLPAAPLKHPHRVPRLVNLDHLDHLAALVALVTLAAPAIHTAQWHPKCPSRWVSLWDLVAPFLQLLL